MVKLSCLLVGVKGSMLSINFDASASGDDLKDAIKQEKENGQKSVDADKLQLFLAKNENNTWLESSEDDAELLHIFCS
jgi:Crinkler effector protein N-terminal domain